MGDATASIIFNLMYLFFWIVVIKKVQKNLANRSQPLALQYSISQLVGQWRNYILRLSNRKWA